jgi:hypothetical protein
MGVLGACFIWLNENLVRFRRKYENDWKILRYLVQISNFYFAF